MCTRFKYKKKKKYLTLTWLYQTSRKRNFPNYLESKRSPQKKPEIVQNYLIKITRNNQYVHTFHSDSYDIHVCQEIFLKHSINFKDNDKDYIFKRESKWLN